MQSPRQKGLWCADNMRKDGFWAPFVKTEKVGGFICLFVCLF